MNIYNEIEKLTLNSTLNKYNTKEENLNFFNFIKYNDVNENKKVIHVLGTNGKGSTSHLLTSSLSENIKIGVFTSPHIFSINERIKVNNEFIEDNFIIDFIKTNTEFLQNNPVSTFEFLTVLALKYFEYKNVDLIILEAGLGGLLDTTNYFKTDISVITNIDFDHIDVLGDSLEQIALQKFGAIRSGNPVFFGDNRENLIHLLEKYASEKGANYIKNEKLVKNVDFSQNYLNFTYNDNQYKCDLNAKYQEKNLNLTLNVLAWISKHWNFQVNLNRLSDVANNTNFFGRFTKYNDIIFDVAHNVAGINNLFENINETNPVIVFGAMKTKDYQTMTKLVLKKSKNTIFTEFNNPLSMKKADFENLGINSTIYTNINDAIDAAKQNYVHKQIYVCGSNYLIGEYKK